MPHRLHTAVALTFTLFALASCASHCRRQAEASKPEDTSTAQSDPNADPIVEPEPTAETGTIPLGQACGPGIGACDAAGYCAFPPANVCGDGGVAGVCEARARGCQKDCKGVCGCDGKRYCNACSAENRGISVRNAGRCAE